MRAVYAEEPYKIGIRDIPVPEIGEDEVLVKVLLEGRCVAKDNVLVLDGEVL